MDFIHSNNSQYNGQTSFVNKNTINAAHTHTKPKSLPPETDGEAERQGLDEVPVLGRHVQHVPGLQQALQVAGLGEAREAVLVRGLAVHLAGVAQQLGVLVGVEGVGEVRVVEAHVLLAQDLAEEVVLGVVVERGHRAGGAEPGVDLHVLLRAQAAVDGHEDVVFQFRDLPGHEEKKPHEKERSSYVFMEFYRLYQQ